MVFLLLLAVACFVYAFWKWQQGTSAKEPPMLPGALPIIGHAHLLIGDSLHLWKAVQSLAQDSLNAGGAISACIGPQKIYVITDPEDYLTVSNTCMQKAIFYDFAKPWLGDGLVTGTLSVWKVHRKLLNPAFSQVVLDGFIGVFNDMSRQLVKDLEVEVGKGPFDHWIYLRHNALETICLTALGYQGDEDAVINHQYVEATETMFNILAERFARIWMHINFIYDRTALKRKQDATLKILHHKSYSVLKKRKAEMVDGKLPVSRFNPENSAKFKAFLDLLLELASEKGAFTDQEIREEVDTMIVGGHDTSAAVLMYVMVMLGSYPRVQEKVYREIQEVFENQDRDVEKYDFPKLVYLEAVIKETLRIHPIVPLTARYLDRDVKLKNYTLSKGRTCFLFICGIMRHKVWGEDVNEFRPERWIENPTWDNHVAFSGFSMGRRMCIGKAYAIMSMKATLVHLLRHYKIKADWTQLQIKLDVMLKPAAGTNLITLEKRQQTS